MMASQHVHVADTSQMLHIQSHENCMAIQWNLYIMDTTGTLLNCPYYRGVLSSEVGSKHAYGITSHTLNQWPLPASLKLPIQQK